MKKNMKGRDEMHLVIECRDRKVLSVRPALDADDAARTADRLLEEHLRSIGCDQGTPDIPGQLQHARAEDGAQGARCSLNGVQYDAHCVEMDDPGSYLALDILLKKLCRAVMASGQYGCGDGTCPDCPVSRTRDMLSA